MRWSRAIERRQQIQPIDDEAGLTFDRCQSINNIIISCNFNDENKYAAELIPRESVNAESR